MSNKDKILEIIDQIPDYKLSYLIPFLRGFQMDDDIEDDLYCEKLYQQYLKLPDEEKETVSFENAVKELGVILDVQD